MLLDDFFSEVGTPPHTAIRPTCPTSANIVGRLKTLAAVGTSDTSDTSDTKTCIVKQNCESKPLEPLPMEWTPDRLNGLPICYLPYLPERLRGVVPPDLRGLGVPMEGLPVSLRGISSCGWTLELLDGKLELKQASQEARNRAGCEGYLRVCYEAVATAWRAYHEG